MAQVTNHVLPGPFSYAFNVCVEATLDIAVSIRTYQRLKDSNCILSDDVIID